MTDTRYPPITTPQWFVETWKDSVANGFKIESRLEQVKTPYQYMEIYQTANCGKLMVLDDCIMLTGAHEFTYHEMITHVPLMAHPNPRNVLVIGGGDGGAMREVLKHPCVEHAVQCEIDEEVTRAAQRHFPQLTEWIDKDPRAECVFADGIAYIKARPNTFDVVIIDSTDPFGPAEGLFKREFYTNVRQSLREGGMMVCQAESIWYSLETVQSMLGEMRAAEYSHIGYYTAQVPMYPGTVWGLSVASQTEYDYTKPCQEAVDSGRVAAILPTCRMYSTRFHKAAFTLPAFAERALTGLAINAQPEA
eukprot:gnl/Trimastix_PCT/705.p1 GENE.gnl/Trimastix_PCT/705~~gnl/Trimastix_PCT/705.p1  ORF type:complete len:316 (+),score=90.27 gnl/Trimastix_PCT/705:33-950(+)